MHHINVCGKLNILLTISLLQSFVVNIKCEANNKRINLSDYIQNGELGVARSLSEVNATYMLGVKSYAGHLSVQQREAKVNLWFWYFPVEGNAVKDAPLMIWLQGGPSISSLMSLFGGVGPFNYKDGNLTKNPFSWHKNHSILFIDNPVGSGFSYTNSDDGYSTNLDEVSTNLYGFLLQFFQLYPELIEVPLFMAGQSYAGKFIPALAHRIHTENLSSKIKMNLKGMAIGNGWIDPPNLIGLSSPAHTVGLIDYNMMVELETTEMMLRNATKEGNWKEANKMLAEILNTLQIRADVPSLYNYVSDQDCYDTLYTEFIKINLTSKFLHVSDIQYAWSDVKTREKIEPDKMSTVVPMLETLLEHYPILFYNGLRDIMVPYVNLENVYRSLNWSGSETYRNVSRLQLKINRQLIGYTKRAGNLQEVLLRDSGHCVASEQSELLMKIITSFTHNEGRFRYEESNSTTTSTAIPVTEKKDFFYS